MKALKIAGIGILMIIFILGVGGFIFFKFYLKPMLEIKPANNQLKTTVYFDKNLVDSIYKYTHKNTRNSADIAIAIIDSGTTHYYGLERKNNQLTTVDNATHLYQIGSISKVFTSTLLAHYVTNQEINLDKTIDQYIGFNLNKNLKLKWKNLANHTSGLDRLPDGSIWTSLKNIDNPYLDYDEKWMIEYLKKKVEIVESKKDKHLYSNLGAAILGQAISLYKKLPFEQLMKQTIFDKYDMPNTFLYKPEYEDKLVKSKDLEDSLTINWELKSFNPAGGIVSNIRDMSRFAMAQLDEKNKELILTHNPTFTIDTTQSIGLGWFIIKSKIGHDVLFHNGATGNFTSSMSIDLNSKKSVIILSNISYTDTGGNLDKLNFAILKYINSIHL